MDNSIPALDRAFAVLEALYAHPEGMDSKDLVAASAIPRTTLYRILRIMAANGYIAPTADGAHVLGPTFLRMASRVALRDDLASRAQAVMQRLSLDFGETVKIVIRDNLESLTIAVTHPRMEARITSHIGTRMPLHVGAPQRLLLAHAPPEVVESVLAQPLPRWASGTITNARQLRGLLKLLAKRDWEFGRNEGPEGIATVAALIHEHESPPRAAIAIVFIDSGKSEHTLRLMREATCNAARALSTA